MQKTPSPVQIVKQAKDEFGATRFVGLFSGGKDSLVTCHYLWTRGLLSEVLYCDTGIKVKENFEFVLKTCNKYGWKLNVETVDPRFNYEELVKRYGFPRQGMHTGTMRWLKWFSIRKFRRNNPQDTIAFVSGRRQKESKRRMKLKKHIELVTEGERKDSPILTVAPLFYWTNKQIWDYIKKEKLEICPVYETLHISGDCLCGCFAESGEAEILAIFHRETAQQISALEKKYGGQWGYNSSCTGALNQSQMDGFISKGNQAFEEIACIDCLIDRKRSGQK